MKNHLEIAKDIQEYDVPHHNCSQVILSTFAEEMGLDRETAFGLGSHFGAGMRCGGTCGAVTGGFMVLGCMGRPQIEAQELMANFMKQHEALDCKTLLKRASEQGRDRKKHCQLMVQDMVEYISTVVCE